MRVLVTASGSPGGFRLVKELKKRGVSVVTTDMNPNIGTKKIVDKFHQSLSGSHEMFIDHIIDVCAEEEIDAILPTSSSEVMQFAKRKREIEKSVDTVVLVAPAEILDRTLDKWFMHNILEEAVIQQPNSVLIGTKENLVNVFDKIISKRCKVKIPLISRPRIGKGSRGVIKFVNYQPHYKLTFNGGRSIPEIEHTKLIPTFYNSLDEKTKESHIILSDIVEGEQIDTVVLANPKGKPLIIEHKTREGTNRGTVTYGKCVHRPELDRIVRKVWEVIPVPFISSIQFIGENVIEINPRLTVSFHTDSYCLPYWCLENALGKLSDSEIKNKKIPIGYEMFRYFDSICSVIE